MAFPDGRLTSFRCRDASAQVEDRRAYHVFEELNTFTAVVYLKKVNHPTAGAERAAAS